MLFEKVNLFSLYFFFFLCNASYCASYLSSGFSCFFSSFEDSEETNSV